MESNNIYKFASRKKWGSVAVCVACFEFFKFLFIVLSYVYYETKHSIETGVIIYCLLLVHFEQKQFLLFNQTIFPYFLPTENAALFYVSLLWTETLDAVVDFYIIGIGIKHLEVWQFVSSSSVNCFGKIVFLIVELLVEKKTLHGDWHFLIIDCLTILSFTKIFSITMMKLVTYLSRRELLS